MCAHVQVNGAVSVERIERGGDIIVRGDFQMVSSDGAPLAPRFSSWWQEIEGRAAKGAEGAEGEHDASSATLWTTVKTVVLVGSPPGYQDGGLPPGCDDPLPLGSQVDFGIFSKCLGNGCGYGRWIHAYVIGKAEASRSYWCVLTKDGSVRTVLRQHIRARPEDKYRPLFPYQVKELEKTRTSLGGNKKRLEILLDKSGPSQLGPGRPKKQTKTTPLKKPHEISQAKSPPPASTVKRGDEALKLLIDGHKVNVICGRPDQHGILDLRTLRIQTLPPHSEELTGTQFEARCGMGDCKNWKMSVRVETDNGRTYRVKNFINDLKLIGAHPPPRISSAT